MNSPPDHVLEISEPAVEFVPMEPRPEATFAPEAVRPEHIHPDADRSAGTLPAPAAPGMSAEQQRSERIAADQGMDVDMVAYPRLFGPITVNEAFENEAQKGNQKYVQTKCKF